jgi:hypothetical protein
MKTAIQSDALTVTCPKCGKIFEPTEAITGQIKDKLIAELENELSPQIKSELEKKYEPEIKKLKGEKDALESEMRAKIKESEDKIRAKLEHENKFKIKDLEVQIKEKDGEIEKFASKELELRKAQRELEKEKRNFQLDMERKLDDERKKIEDEAKKGALTEYQLSMAQKDKQIGDLNKQIEELKSSAEQGSQQSQGDVLEVELENLLRENFPGDRVEPVPTGVSGGDIIQRVWSPNRGCCGTILWESKRTRNWSDAWITKLRDDVSNTKADVGVIVTKTLPEGVDNFSIIRGIVVMSYQSIVPITVLVRNQLVELARVRTANINQNEKMSFLQSYMTGNEFRQKIERFAEAIQSMYSDLQREKNSTVKQWAKREKQIERAVYSIAEVYGNLQGIMDSLPEIPALELPESQSLPQMEEEKPKEQ